MHPLWLVLLVALLPGCAVFCGPTVYYLSGVTASTVFPVSWDAAAAEAGLRALGAKLGRGTECSAQGSANGTSIEVNGCSPGSTSIRISYAMKPAIQGEREHVEEAADEIIAARTPDAEALLATFSSATGWKATGGLAWDKGLLHGDC